MKPNYQAMNKTELRDYVLAHKEDMEAVRLLFQTPDYLSVVHYPAVSTEEGLPIKENIKIMEEAIKQKITDRMDNE